MFNNQSHPHLIEHNTKNPKQQHPLLLLRPPVDIWRRNDSSYSRRLKNFWDRYHATKHATQFFKTKKEDPCDANGNGKFPKP